LKQARETRLSGSSRRLLERIELRLASKRKRPGVPEFTRITRRQRLTALRMEGGGM
jgi:hypothetical protein